MTPCSVVIRYNDGRGRMELYIPAFFDSATLPNIRKVLKLLGANAHQNDSAIETLDWFIASRVDAAEQLIGRTNAELETAKKDLDEKRQRLVALGATVDERIEQAKLWIVQAKKKAKTHPEEVDACQAILDKVARPKTDYQQAVKRVKSLEASAKQARAALERIGKVRKAYNQILR